MLCGVWWLIFYGMCVGFSYKEIVRVVHPCCVCSGAVALAWVVCFVWRVCDQLRICVCELKICVACGLGVERWTTVLDFVCVV